MIRSASDLIDLETPNYQFVAARLLLFGLYKQVFGPSWNGFPVYDGDDTDTRFLDFVLDPEIQSDVFVERGKYSATENFQRIGEVDNIGDLVRYGYGYFKINTT